MKLFKCDGCDELYEQEPQPHCEICGGNTFTEVEQEEIEGV